MSSPRRNLWRGVILGIILCFLGYGGLRLAGYHLMRQEMAPASMTGPQTGVKPLCYVSPTDPEFIRPEPGKDPQGRDLVPVYPAPAGAEAGKIKYWVSPTDPKYVSSKPGKDPMGHDLIPAYGEMEKPAAPSAKKERKIKYWVDPMNPTNIQDHPGKAPCGMDMVPVYEEEGEAAAPGAITVSPTAIQSMGVRTAKVEVKPMTHNTWTVGLVTFNERNLAVINTKVAGWVDRLYINATGDSVRKGQQLLSIYSPELVSAQEECLLAMENFQALKNSPYKEVVDGARRLFEAAHRRMLYFDISHAQIEDLTRTHQVKKHLVLASPVKGIVTKRMVTQGQMVQAGMPLLEVADLSTVWVDADIYQYELPWIKVGQKVEMTLQYLPGETFTGRIDYIYPYLKENTRTARVRLRFPNPKLKLKPDMFAQVEIKSPATKEAVIVPSEAVLDTGLKQHVFVALGGGKFEPREVKLGVYGNGNHYREVLSGLKGGEEIVTSAQFLLDSESRFREAIQTMLPPQGAPEKGKEAAPQAMPGMKMEGPKEAAPPAAPTPMPPGHKH
ncbi:MAG: efflux RND transporter periplasmic adaptor subunit [Deltaproteobacteria bacterium]|nr:efflux RND transporter periplasmic adaptor subunit [Deltaproteobacteria bacterium]